VPSRSEGVVVREATVDDELDVRRVLDAAMLESTATSDAVARGDAFVAVAGGDVVADGGEGVDEGGVADAGVVVGALVLVPHSTVELPDAVAEPGGAVAGGVGMHVDAVAVRRRRRGQGIGGALVEAALERERRLTVAFDPGVRAFYDALDFATVLESEETADGRAWAVREGNASLHE
jgi:GNAT superfamily N-acetyltransferase